MQESLQKKFSFFNTFSGAFFDLFFSNSCLECEKKMVIGETVFCLDCVKNLEQFSIPLKHQPYEMNPFLLKDIVSFVSLYRFQKKGVSQTLVHGIKYKKKHFIAEFLIFLNKERLKKHYESIDFDAIICVPIHKKRLSKRGYNQSELFCNEISKILSIPVDKNTLVRIKHTLSQTRITPEKRQTNLLGAFTTIKNTPKYKSILLVDDVYTTGATLLECVKALKSIHIDNIHILTILRVEDT